MSKNLTRKGLAFGALVALGTSVITGAPAQAAGSITLNPSTGTAWNTLSTSTFSVSPVITGVNADEFKYLRYKVTNTDELQLRVDVKQGTTDGTENVFVSGSTAAATAYTSTTVSYAITDSTSSDVVAVTLATGEGAKYSVGDAIYVSGLNAGAVGATNGTYTVSAVSGNVVSFIGGALVSSNQASANDVDAVFRNLNKVNDDSFVVAPFDLASGANLNAIGSANHLVLGLADTTKATSLKVQAWIDGNQNNVIDGGESVATEQTVGFKKLSTLSASVSLSGVRYASDDITATVSLTGEINYQQVTANQVVVNIADAADISTGAPTWNPVTAGWEYAVSATSTGLSAGEVVTAKVWDDANINGTATVADGDTLKVTGTATAGSSVSNPTFELKAVNAANVVTTAAAQSDTGSNDTVGYVTQAGTAYVRTGTASFNLTGFVGSDAVTTVGADSAEISIAVGSTNVTNTDSITVGGKAVTNGAATLVTKTDANGLISAIVNLGSADDGDVLTFTTTITGSAVSTAVLTVNVTDGSFAATQVTPGALSIKAGDKVAVDYRVVDEFGVAPTNNTYSIVVTPTANERTTAATWSNTLQVVDGKASLAVTDNGVGDGKFVASAQLYKGASSVGSAITTTVNVVADPVAKTITAEKLAYGTEQAKDLNNDGDYADTDEVDNTAKLLVSTKTFGNYDSRYALPTDVAPTVTDATKVVVGGKVTNAAGTAIAGAPVTFAAKGFLFKSGTVYALDSITVRAGSTGIASVEAWSQVGGSQSVAITSGAATAAQALVYAAGTTTAASHTVVTSSATLVPGRTLDVTVNVKDKFGNAAQGVAVALRSTGAGYLQAATGTTDAAGNVYVKLISGINDSGTATIIATVTIAGIATEKSATVTVYAAPAAAPTSANASASTGKINVAVTAAAGKTVVVKVDGKFASSFSATGAKKAVSVKSAKGAKTVTIYVGGKLVKTVKVTVK